MNLLTALTIAFVGAIFFSPSPAHATVYNHTYLQFNMCGNNCNSGRTAVADDVVRSVTERNPYIVTLNEVCENQWNHLYSRVPHSGRFDPTGPTCSNGARYGNAILVRGSYSYLGSWALPEPAGGENRKIMCIRPALSGAPTMTACVTHISNISGNQAAQINAVASRVNGYWASGAVLLGGDFNVRPHDARMNPLYSRCYSNGTGRFYELDSGNCSRTTGTTVNEPTHNAYKIDYLFVSEEWSNRNGDVTTAPRSDHRPYWGTGRIGY